MRCYIALVFENSGNKTFFGLSNMFGASIFRKIVDYYYRLFFLKLENPDLIITRVLRC